MTGVRVSQVGVRRMLATLAELGADRLRWRLAVVSAWSFVAGMAQAGLLVTVTELVAGVAAGRRGVTVHGHHLSVAGAVATAFGLLAAYAVAGLASARVAAAAAGTAVTAVRGSVIRSYFGAGWPVQAAERLGHVQQLLSVNCDRVGTVVTGIAGGFQAVLSVAALLAAAAVVDPVAAVLVVVVSTAVPGLFRPVAGRARSAGRTLTVQLRGLATLATEYARLGKELRVLGVTDRAIGRLEDRNEAVGLQYRRTRTLLQSSPVAYQAFALGCITAAAAVLASVAGTGAGTGGLAAVLLLTLRSLTYGTAVQQAAQVVRTSEPAIDLLADDVRRYRRRPSVLPGPVPAGADRFDLSVEGVSFSYPAGPGRRPALDDVTFVVPDGHILGVVGRSGSGKTTLGEVVLGLRAPTCGRVLVGGVPVAARLGRDRDGWAAVVGQDAPVCRGSVADNIAFFRDLDRPAVVAAARAAHLHDDIVALPRGYDTVIGERGTALSGGQRQRLAIARALAGRPRLVVLDEPTSALDGWSERSVGDTVAALRGRATVVVISHRRATVAGCDLLLVLDRGRVAAFGPADRVAESGLVPC
ncbi:MAG TPA: ATP-binding cassette domain-containing protein [Acidimicrobiales bacterium]|nr:ATP-binding cassette domain-containing protein [Acidimicrobiales bacterium]